MLGEGGRNCEGHVSRLCVWNSNRGDAMLGKAFPRLSLALHMPSAGSGAAVQAQCRLGCRLGCKPSAGSSAGPVQARVPSAGSGAAVGKQGGKLWRNKTGAGGTHVCKHAFLRRCMQVSLCPCKCTSMLRECSSSSQRRGDMLRMPSRQRCVLRVQSSQQCVLHVQSCQQCVLHVQSPRIAAARECMLCNCPCRRCTSS